MVLPELSGALFVVAVMRWTKAPVIVSVSMHTHGSVEEIHSDEGGNSCYMYWMKSAGLPNVQKPLFYYPILNQLTVPARLSPNQMSTTIRAFPSNGKIMGILVRAESQTFFRPWMDVSLTY